MITSPEQALLLMRKWFDEKTLLKVMLVPHSGFFTVRMMGFIGSLSENGIIVGSHADKTRAPDHYIELNPTSCRFYDYLEAKDIEGESDEVRQYLAKYHGVAGLTIVLSDKTRVSFFEQAEGNV